MKPEFHSVIRKTNITVYGMKYFDCPLTVMNLLLQKPICHKYPSPRNERFSSLIVHLSSIAIYVVASAKKIVNANMVIVFETVLWH